MTVQPPEQPIPRDLPISPDCLGAPYKCGACSGDAWDDAMDELTACACPCHVVPRDLPCQHPALITITGRPGWLECVTCGETLPDPEERP